MVSKTLGNTKENKIRLNRYISNAGICSRREADKLIHSGFIKVNGSVVTKLGTVINKDDEVLFKNKIISPEKKVYIVLNKPKDYITTVKDIHAPKNVMQLVENACNERIYPVGRLDRNTTGILVFTNDGELTKKLTHPKYRRKKIYHVFFNKDVDEKHIKDIKNGIDLEDGFIKADAISYVGKSKKEIGIELHSGKNRIVRRIFKHFGYHIKKLDRVYFSGLTKKNLPRGKWRFLSREEVNLLKFYNS